MSARWYRLTVFLLLSGAIWAAEEYPGKEAIAAARAELLAALPAPVVPATDQPLADECARARLVRLRLLALPIRVFGPRDRPLAGVTVRALVTHLDLAGGPVVTDDRGLAVIRLPPGDWRVDLTRSEPGRVAFARIRIAVQDAAEREVRLADVRRLSFKTRSASLRTPDGLTLATPDFSFVAPAEAREGRLEVVTTPGTPILAQATKRPAEKEGFVLRGPVGPGQTTFTTDPAGATSYEFRGLVWRKLEVSLTSADGFPLDFSFPVTCTRSVKLSGLAQVVVTLGVSRKGESYAFYPLPFDLDGAERSFTGEPPFVVTVGHKHNTSANLGGRRYTVSFRVFLCDKNGLLLQGNRRGTPYEVAWEQLLRGQVRGSGKITRSYRNSTEKLDREDFPHLLYRLHVRGPGEDRTLVVKPHLADSRVSSGKVSTTVFPEVAPNSRLWLRCVETGVRAYEDICTTRRKRVNVGLWTSMPKGISGFGGYNGSTGFIILSDGRVFGFAGTSYWNGLLAHELGHAHNYWHGHQSQTRKMTQAMRRAGRRYLSLVPGPTRTPAGNRFLPVLEALTSCELGPAPVADPPPPEPKREKEAPAVEQGELEPNLEPTGEDDFLVWYLRSFAGLDADHRRRRNEGLWFWHLVKHGYTEEECRAVAYSLAAGENLGWLARVRRMGVTDERVEAATALLTAPDACLSGVKERRRIIRRWSKFDARGTPDLVAAAEQVLAEVGVLSTRSAALLSIAREQLRRKEEAAARTTILTALVDARRGTPEFFDEMLARAAATWAAR